MKIQDCRIKNISSLAEQEGVENFVFLGLKGIGKTSLFDAYFTDEKKEELAQSYKHLFVSYELKEKRKEEDLYVDLKDCIIEGLELIPDEEVLERLEERIESINSKFKSADTCVKKSLDAIKKEGYHLILIMDDFHTMARNTEIGEVQYDILRSLGQKKRLTYWLITDTDLNDPSYSRGFVSSFFAQNFVSKTILSLEKDDNFLMQYALNYKKGDSLTEDDTKFIYNLAGGNPLLMMMLVEVWDGLPQIEEGRRENFIEAASNSLKCKSLFANWVEGLSVEQKKLIAKISDAEDEVSKDELTVDVLEIEKLADNSGRGILRTKEINMEKRWYMAVPLFRYYVLKEGAGFYCEDKSLETTEVSEALQTGGNIINIGSLNINGAININNYSIQNLVAGVDELYQLVNKNPEERQQISEKLNGIALPFKADGWNNWTEEAKEKELDKFADDFANKSALAKETLTDDQLRRFYLTQEFLDRLSEECRKQIICGIMVYDILQKIVDDVGLPLGEWESVRGILFARAFEKHLKDVFVPVFLRIPEFANHTVSSGKTFLECTPSEMTIGTFQFLLSKRKNYLILAEASLRELNDIEHDAKWWKKLTSDLFDIKDLRNDCCHSEHSFKSEDLQKMLHLIFEKGTIEKVCFAEKIPALKVGQFSYVFQDKKTEVVVQNNDLPDLKGQEVEFKIETEEKKAKGVINYKGIVNGQYQGVLNKNASMEVKELYGNAKGKSMKAVVQVLHKDQGVYVLRLK